MFHIKIWLARIPVQLVNLFCHMANNLGGICSTIVVSENEIHYP